MMNHYRLIQNIINKYSDFPAMQADLRKVLKYAESQHRQFLTPIIKDLPIESNNND